MVNDPSGDNFEYYMGTDFDNLETPLLERYKNFNVLDGNLQLQNNLLNHIQLATSLPNSEDINRDNTLGESESYFQYKIRLSPQTMDITNPYISDILENQCYNKKWRF